MDPVTTSALIGGATGIVGGAASGLFKPSLKKQWRYQQKQMRLQQQYALEQLTKQAELNYNNWQKQFDYENEWNDPTAVFDRYLKAGVTPAAVLGSSGVGVNATMGASGASVSGASGPSAGSMDFGNPMVGVGSTAAGSAIGMMEARSAVDRNKAAAELDRAEAANIKNRTQSPEYYASVANLDKQALEVGIKDASALAALHDAQATIESSRAQYADLSATYALQDLMAHYAQSVETARRLRAQNDAEIPYMSQMVAADLSLTLAQASAARSNAALTETQADIAQVTLADVQNWFSLNWNTEISVPQVTESGKPTGKTVKMTGKQIKEYLMGLEATSGAQGMQAAWYNIRSEKNAFGYRLANTVVAAAAAGAVAAATKGAGAAGAFGSTTGGSSSSSRTTYVDPDGNVTGYVLNEMTGEKHSVSRRRYRK